MLSRHFCIHHTLISLIDDTQSRLFETFKCHYIDEHLHGISIYFITQILFITLLTLYYFDEKIVLLSNSIYKYFQFIISLANFVTSFDSLKLGSTVLVWILTLLNIVSWRNHCIIIPYPVFHSDRQYSLLVSPNCFPFASQMMFDGLQY